MSRARGAVSADSYDLADKWLERELEEISKNLRSRPPLRRGPFIIIELDQGSNKRAQSKKR